MMTQELTSRSMQLQALCDGVRKYAKALDYQKCVTMICQAMGEFPNAPQPHNLLGIVMEKEGDHAGAMKHFRAAYALDPTYFTERMVFLLVQALPQTPVNAVLRVAAARFS